jgi:hypothetical protein
VPLPANKCSFWISSCRHGLPVVSKRSVMAFLLNRRGWPAIHFRA